MSFDLRTVVLAACLVACGSEQGAASGADAGTAPPSGAHLGPGTIVPAPSGHASPDFVRLACPTTSFLVGFRAVEATGGLSALALECRELHPDGTQGDTTVTEFFGDRSAGTEKASSCASPLAMPALDIWFDERVITGMGGFCADAMKIARGEVPEQTTSKEVTVAPFLGAKNPLSAAVDSCLGFKAVIPAVKVFRATIDGQPRITAVSTECIYIHPS
jgi:hypothetical protein